MHEVKKRWRRCRVTDFSYCGNQEVLVLTNKGVLSRWKFSKLEIGECIQRLDLELEEGEKTHYLNVDREYNFAIVDAQATKSSATQDYSTRSFLVALKGLNGVQSSTDLAAKLRHSGFFGVDSNNPHDIESSLSVRDLYQTTPKHGSGVSIKKEICLTLVKSISLTALYEDGSLPASKNPSSTKYPLFRTLEIWR